MRKHYETPKAETIELSTADVVTASPVGGGQPNEYDGLFPDVFE